MQQKISYEGISFRQDDYHCADGELTTVLNLINEDGALRPAAKPEVILRLGGGDRLLYIHRGTGYANYIIYSDGKGRICYISKENPGERNNICDAAYDDTALDSLVVTSMGNTLVIIDGYGTNYVIFNGGGYKDIGRKPPVASLVFGLNGEFETGELNGTIINGHVGSATVPPSSRNRSFTLKDIEAGGMDYVNWIIEEFTGNTLASVNKFIQERATDKNKFIFPFLIRYAYRLYDGTYMMHSYPVLMVPVNGCNPVFFLDRMNCHADGDNAGVAQTQLNMGGYTSALLCDIDYKFDGYSAGNIEDWKDIIKSIDIFVTAPVYTYDQNGKVYGWRRLADDEKQGNYSVAKINNPSAKWKNDRPADTLYNSYGDQPYEYQFMSTHDYTSEKFYFDAAKGETIESIAHETMPGFHTPRYFMELPEVKDDEWIKNIQEASVFYRIASIDFSELKNDSVARNVTIKDNILKTLHQQPVLPDDYKSHCDTGAECAYVYNSRLNLGNITERIFKGMPVNSQFTRWDFHPGISGISGKTEIFVHIKKDGKEYVVKSPDGKRNNHVDFYFFYPDTDAYKITVVRYGTAGTAIRRYSIPLTEHPLLNGSYYFTGFSPVFENVDSSPVISGNLKVRYPSKIYTSEVNNPFVFTPARINSVGNGDITALCSATKAISEGQFGQFPMHAFTTEGIWALEVNETGGYSSRQPVTRDVLTGKHVLQLDQCLAYPTGKGIMLLQGGTSQCITSVLDGKFNPFCINKYMQIAGEFGFEDHNSNYDFKEFIKGCVLAYDYVNSLIYISNNEYGYSYVYAVISGKWSIITESFANTVNSYPEAIVTMRPVKRGNIPVYEDVYNLNGKEYFNSAMIITRPLKLGAHDVLKTISSVVARGMFSRRKEIAKTVLLGSADGISYIPVSSSLSGEIRNIRGSGYKYFRLMHELRLNPEERFTGVEIEFEPRHSNRLR